jgi:hypothetical protein
VSNASFRFPKFTRKLVGLFLGQNPVTNPLAKIGVWVHSFIAASATASMASADSRRASLCRVENDEFFLGHVDELARFGFWNPRPKSEIGILSVSPITVAALVCGFRLSHAWLFGCKIHHDAINRHLLVIRVGSIHGLRRDQKGTSPEASLAGGASFAGALGVLASGALLAGAASGFEFIEVNTMGGEFIRLFARHDAHVQKSALVFIWPPRRRSIPLRRSRWLALRRRETVGCVRCILEYTYLVLPY